MGDHPSSTSVTHDTAEGIPAAPPTGPAWRRWAVGTRVVVRRRLPEGGLTDVLGDLLAVDDDGVLVETRRGPVRVPGTDIALGKPVPPPPARRPAGATGPTTPTTVPTSPAAPTGDEAP